MTAVPSTIRFRVTAIATGVVLVVLIVTGLVLVAVQRRVLTENLDESIVQHAVEIGADVANGRGATSMKGLGEDDAAAQVVDEDGAVIAASANLLDAPPIADPPPEGADRSVRTVDGLPHDPAVFRIASVRGTGPAGTFVVHVAGTRDDIDESVRSLTRSLVLAVPVIVALLAALVWWLVGRTLRPVEAIRAEVDSIGGHQLDRRVPVPAGDDEIARLASTMNGMLARMQDAAARQRRFVADASHELRSPLTRMRAELEVDIAHPAGADPAATQRSVLDEVVGLQHLVDDLLVLASADDQRNVAPIDELADIVDLDGVVARAVRTARVRPDVRVEVATIEATPVRGHADQLARAVANVADNAVRHASNVVSISLESTDGMLRLAVTDDGAGIPVADRARIFERFARVDDARSAGGTGLGLAIAKEIVERHGGAIAVDTDHTPGTRMVITLPVARSPD